MLKINRIRGRMIALICAISMFFYAVPISALAQEAIPPGTIPYGASPAKPAVIVSNFPTGTPDIVYESQFQSLNQLADFLKANPSYKVVMVGTVSDLPIYGGCYIDPKDPKFFDLHAGPQFIKYDNKKDTNEACQTYLAKSRDFTVADWLTEHGVLPAQIFILDFYALTMNAGGNFPNQSVVCWWVTTQGIVVDGPKRNDDQGYVYGPTSNALPSETFQYIWDLPACCKKTESRAQINGITVITYKVDCTSCEIIQAIAETEPCEKECPWYNRGPCMSTGEKIFWGSLGAAGLIALILAVTVKAESNTSHTSSCAGAGC